MGYRALGRRCPDENVSALCHACAGHVGIFLPDVVLRFAFRGGNTHCNRFFAGDIVKNVKGRDISSSYPTQECLEKYPMTPFKKRDRLSESGIDYYMENGAACLIHAVLRCAGLRDPFEAIPYLPLAKRKTIAAKKVLS